MSKRSRPKLSESDLELFNRVVADVKPLKFQDKPFINKRNSINTTDTLKKTNMISREIKPIKQLTNISKIPIVIGDHSPGRGYHYNSLSDKVRSSVNRRFFKQ